MTAIATNFQPGNTITSAAFNSHALALKAQGIANDDAGKLILAASLDVPFTIASSLGSVQSKAVGPSTTYTVPSGKLFFIRSLTFSGTPGAALSIDPAAGSAFNSSGVGYAAGIPNQPPVGLCLGAGDAIVTGTNTALNGILGDLPSAPSAPTVILQEINNSTTYTVPAGKALLLTHAYPSTSATVVTLTIDGVAAYSAAAIMGANTTQVQPWRPLYLAAGQVLAVATAANFTISGLLFSV